MTAIQPRRLARRVAVLLRQRRHLRAQAPAYVLRYYRDHRRLPPGYVLVLLPASIVRRIRLRAEIEHALGFVRLLAWLQKILHRSSPVTAASPCCSRGPNPRSFDADL